MSGTNKVYKIAIGNVFVIPVDENYGYVGQIVGRFSAEIYVIILDATLAPDAAEADIDQALEAKPIFGTLTYEARFRPGMWQIVGNRPADSKRLLPAYKTGDPGMRNCMVENFEGTQRRPATQAEWETLPHRSTRAPMGLEKAVLAHARVRPWEDNFEKLKIGNQMPSESLFPTG